MDTRWKDTIRGSLEILAAFALAGSSIPLGKKLVGELPVFLTAFLSLTTAMLVLGPVLWIRRKELLLIDRKNILLIIGQSLAGMVLFRIFLFSGLKLTGALPAAIITSLTPLVMALAGMLFLRERLKPRLAAALVLASAGILVIRLLPDRMPVPVIPSQTGFRGGLSWLGDILVLLAVCSEAAMTIFRKKASPGIGSLTNTALIVLVSFFLTLPLAAGEALLTGFLPALTLPQLSGLVYYGAGATALAYILWGSGCRKLTGGQAGLFMAAMPLTAAVLSVAVLGEHPTTGILLGGGLVLIGMLIGVFVPKT
jgi:drug/metabolite transporter (DMT)-like permease